MNHTENAILRAATPPNPEQETRLAAFLKKTYEKEIPITWEKTPGMTGGFQLQVGADLYDWSLEGRVQRFKEKVDRLLPAGADDIPLMKESLENWTPEVTPQEIGHVASISDEVAVVVGLDHAAYGEILEFASGVKGMVQELRRDQLGCILFGDGQEIVAGSQVRRTGKNVEIPVGEGFLGRVVDPLGNPIDGLGEIPSTETRPIETAAPEIIRRQPVNTPMETGILSIDAMFPIGRGQRELIIGDRQTGKTALAVDAILNQKGKNMICIYVAIGQKTSSVASVVETLRRRGAMEYSIVMCAPASNAASLQYIAPYAGCSLGEYFMYQGKDVLIVYDDLSKHAIAYRALSLLLERSPGREAYPGDVFYLHSRLLERSARLAEDYGGGSITALPIIETQAGDVSAYIPTNVISITDGQIFLETDLFFAGQRPAVNVGLSVSRVGGDAQTKAMKNAAGAIRLDLAQYREMEVFTQFSSDLDDATKAQLAYGAGLMALLRQPQYHPMSQHEQVITLVAAMDHVMQNIPAAQIKEFQNRLLTAMAKEHEGLCREIDETGKLSDEARQTILTTARALLAQYQAAQAGKEGGGL